MLTTIRKILGLIAAARKSRGLAGVLEQIADGREFARRFKLTETMYVPPAAQNEKKGDLETWFDSHTVGNGVVKWRHYFSIYEKHLNRFRNRPLCLMEVGIYSGGSLEMWKDYFGDECKIIGVDIEKACKSYEQDGVEVVIGDQGDPEFWRSLQSQGLRADVIIDDGGHLWSQQICTLRGALNILNPGGVFICEDIHQDNNRFLAFCSGLINEFSQYNLVSPRDVTPTEFQKCVASLHFYPYMVVIEKNSAQVSHFGCDLRGTVWQPFLGLDKTLD